MYRIATIHTGTAAGKGRSVNARTVLGLRFMSHNSGYVCSNGSGP